MENKNYRILYIMGPGRSGTTILEILLANNSNVTGVGEVTHIFRDGLVKNVKCSCDNDFRDCELWSHVFSGLDNMIPGNDYYKLQQSMDGHIGVLREVLHLKGGKKTALYNKINRELFDRVHEKTGAKVIVDSSKYASRAINLKRIFGDQLLVLIVSRDSAGLKKSFSKPHKTEQKPKNILQMLLYLSAVYASIFMARAIVGKNVKTIRYEDMLSNPTQVMNDIADWAGFESAEVNRKLENGEVLSVHHIITGNRIRKQKDLKFISKPEERRQESGLMLTLLDKYRAMLKL